ncbi:MAG: phage tail protein [Coriobacteriia bacterium]|nr:phage tail protein [Coriobacteriia bacterium]
MNTQYVHTGKPNVGGAIFTAPAGTEVPTDATTPLANVFIELGYASEDGITNSIETENNAVNAWGGDEVLNEITSRSEQFSFTLIETSVATLKEVYGAENVRTDADGIAVLHNARGLAERVHVYEILMGAGQVKRIVVPRVKTTELGDVVYNGSDPVGYELTLAALPDAMGNTAYEYIAEVVSGDVDG